MKTKWLVIAAFLFGLTWNASWSSSCGEIRGYVAIEQRLLGVEAVFRWSGAGFNNKYPLSWNIYKLEPKRRFIFGDLPLDY
jgi:hypothetical protein